jgi:hypothetical protein
MNLTNEQLAEVLKGAGVSISSETLTILRDGLGVLRSRYEMETARDSPIKIREDFVRLCKSLSIVVDKLERDAGLYTAMMVDDSSDAWDLRRHLIEQQRALLAAVERASKLFLRKGRSGRRRDPATGFLIQAYTLLATLIAKRPGIAGPAHRFTMQCAEILGLGSIVPKNESSYRKGLTLWLRHKDSAAPKHFTRKMTGINRDF